MMSQPLWTSRELAVAVGGNCDGRWYVDGIAIDSREVIPGDLFIALKGDKTDGHLYVRDALAAGASGAILARSIDGLDATDPRLLFVRDTKKALVEIAKAARARMHGPVLAITGSAGKTSVKEALRSALGRDKFTHANIRSFNNHVGVPLSLARMPRATSAAVFEIGTGSPGEIAPLARLVRPHVAVVTSVGPAHLEAFEDIEAIANEKASLFDALEPGGTAILNADTHCADILMAKAEKAASKIVPVSIHKGKGDAYPVRLKSLADMSCMTADILGTIVTCKIGIPGRHWVMNALLALSAIRMIDGDLGLAALALSDLRAPAGRGARHIIPVPGGSALLIDESYNANPLSFKAAFDALKGVNTGSCGRKIVVLGDMCELGAGSSELHLSLVPDLRSAGVAEVIAVGPQMTEMAKEAGVFTRVVPNAKAAADRLRSVLKRGDVVLVKGANVAGLSNVTRSLIDLGKRYKGGHMTAQLAG